MILVEKFIFVVFDYVKLAKIFLTSLTKVCCKSWAFRALDSNFLFIGVDFVGVAIFVSYDLFQDLVKTKF